METKKAIIFLIVIAVLGVLFYFFIGKSGGVQKNFNLKSQTSGASGITFEVAPLDFNPQNPVKFEIKIDTHSDSLDFDLTEISSLEDDLGNKYSPLQWQGPAPGGHHLSGTLLFPKINSGAEKIKLTIRDSAPRIFNWDLK